MKLRDTIFVPIDERPRFHWKKYLEDFACIIGAFAGTSVAVVLFVWKW